MASDSSTAMPGDPDEAQFAASTPHNDTDAPAKRRGRPRKEDKDTESAQAEKAEAKERGIYTPVQYEDDGWGDLPEQARS